MSLVVDIVEIFEDLKIIDELCDKYDVTEAELIEELMDYIDELKA